MNRQGQTFAAEVRYCRRSPCFGCPSPTTELWALDAVADERKVHR
jgi:hypothetical protein